MSESETSLRLPPFRNDKLVPVPAPPEKTNLGALARLEASRTRIREGLQPFAHPAEKPSLSSRLGSWQQSFKDAAMRVPGVQLISRAVRDWWTDHPARQAGAAAGKASISAVTPVVRRHPLGFLAVSAAFGAVTVLARPWRRPSVKRVLDVVGQIASYQTRATEESPWRKALAPLFNGRW